MKRLASLLLALVAMPVVAAPIRVGANLSGWNYQSPSNPGGYTEQPFTDPLPATPDYSAPGAVLKPAALTKTLKLDPYGGVIRFMDAQQTVGSGIDSWGARSTNNLSAKGISIESIIAVSNQTHSTPWVNAPYKTDVFFDTAGADVTQSWQYQAGRQLALGLDPRIKTIKYEDSNERWNGGDQNQGTAAMIRARTSPLVSADARNGANDFKALSEMAAIDWFRGADAFTQGVESAGKGFVVQGEAPAFMANPYYQIYGQDALNRVFGATNPKLVKLRSNSRAVVAPYGPGAPTDIGGVTASDTPATIMARTKTFVQNNFLSWVKTNRDAAISYGMKGVDYYETMDLSTYLFDGNTKLVDMARSTNDQSVRDFHTWFLNYCSDIADGVLDNKNLDPTATLILFGTAGIPYSAPFGEWAAWESYLSGDTDKSIAITQWVAESANNVDPMPAGVPEPSSGGVVTVAGLLFLMGRRSSSRSGVCRTSQDA